MSQIYEHRTSMTVSGGSTTTTSLSVIHGLMQQLLILANTSTTVFRASIVDDGGITRMNWGFSKGELNEIGSFFPIVNKYKINITNASQTDTFQIIMAVKE